MSSARSGSRTGRCRTGTCRCRSSQEPCGTADAEGEIRERIQTNGRCEASNPRGDTYGPVSYLAYLPGYAVFGWTGKWDELWAAHATSLLFDALCILGLALVGRRFGGPRLAATLAFAWAAYPFTLYVSNSNTNDAIMPAFLIWGFWLASSAWARGAAVALAGWTKFAALLLAPLWLSYPNGWRAPGEAVRARPSRARRSPPSSILLLEPDPLHAARVFGERTFGFQLDRESPFSIWGWGQYHAAGVPDLHVVQQVLEVLLVAGAVLVAFVPRRKSILQLAALTAAVLIGFELVLTHWFYLYIPWFFPFVAFAVLYRRDRVRARFTELAAVAAAALFLLSWGVLHTALVRRGRDRRHPGLRDLRQRDRGRRGAVSRHPARVPARRAPRVRRCRRSSATTTQGFRDVFEWLMAALRRRDRAARRRSRCAGCGPRGRGRSCALALVAGFPLLLGSVVLTRFDL